MNKYKIGDHVIIEESNVEDEFPRAGHKGVIIAFNHVDEKHYPYFYRVKVDGCESKIWCKVRCLVPDEKIIITHDGKTTTATLYKGDEKISAKAKCASEDTFDFEFGAKLAMERLFEKTKEVVVDGFKVGDRVNFNGYNGTVICISIRDSIGVEFDKPNKNGIHNCGGVPLKAGKQGTSLNCKWFNVTKDFLKHGEVEEPYNGKVVCIDLCNCNQNNYTVGKIYRFVDGILTTDDGFEMNNCGNKPFHSFEEWSRFTSSKFIEVVE